VNFHTIFTKHCPSCGLDKGPEEYYHSSTRRGGGLSAYCKECMKKPKPPQPTIVRFTTDVRKAAGWIARSKVMHKRTEIYLYNPETDQCWEWPYWREEPYSYFQLLEKLVQKGYSIKNCRQAKVPNEKG
jgi:hypothetical protein